MPGHLAYQAHQFEHARLYPTADVNDFLVHTHHGGGVDHGINHIIHVHVIARLLTIAMDDHGAIREGVFQEVGDDGRVGHGNPLARPVGIKNPQADGLNPRLRADGADVMFRCQLGHSIGGAGVHFKAFLVGDVFLDAVNRAGRYQDNPPYLRVPHGFHQRNRSAHVHHVVVAREKDGFRYGNTRSKVKNALHILQQLPEERLVVDVTLDKFDLRL